MAQSHSLSIEADEMAAELVIHRIYPDGNRVLCTRISFSRIKSKGFQPFALELGELIVFDTPVLRRLLLDR